MVVSHFAFQLSPGYEGGYGIDNQQINSAAPDKDFSDVQCLFSRVRLRDEQAVHINTEGTGIAEFWLSKKEKDRLYRNGRKAAEEFFDRWDSKSYHEEYSKELKA